MIRISIQLVVSLILVIKFTAPAKAWSEHPLLARPVLSSIPELAHKEPVPVMSLKAFLLKEEEGLARLFRDYESWARENLGYYPWLPEELKFQKTGNADDILQRFFYAARLNPNVKMQLYLHLMPNEDIGDLKPIHPSALTTLKDVEFMMDTKYVELFEDQMASPLQIVSTANDEPDYGFDLGLFEDNNTDYGKKYGFGIQPFGDPNLEYGSQAPFHMGFYHENSLVFKFGPFLKRTLPEYRIFLFKMLSEYAFQTGNDYWGWRFMGWGMHYLSDLSMPYHTAPLPGVSAFRMIWINMKAMIGLPRSKNNAVQIVSNRHSVLEQYQWILIKEAYKNDFYNQQIVKALKNPIDHVDFSVEFPRDVAALESVNRSKKVDKNLKKWMPKKLVSDPKFETPGSPELQNLVELARAEKGDEAIEGMNEMLCEIMRSYSMHMRSYYKSISEKIPA